MGGALGPLSGSSLGKGLLPAVPAHTAVDTTEMASLPWRGRSARACWRSLAKRATSSLRRRESSPKIESSSPMLAHRASSRRPAAAMRAKAEP